MEVTLVDGLETLYECFKTDKDLIQKWHVDSGKGLDACVKRTYKDLKSAQVRVYELKKDSELFGYFGIEKESFLTGFFIIPKFRTKDGVTMFWNEVDNKFKDPIYYTGLYNKNIPAIKFIEKRGKKVLDVGDGSVFMIIKEC